MKALDTPVLLDLLRGSADALRLVRSVGNEELATTELNLWELGQLAIEDRSPGRERRLAAIDRLRRKLLVLPVDAASIKAALAGAVRERKGRVIWTTELIYGTLEAHGCSAWVTVPEALPDRPRGAVKLVEYPKSTHKARK